MQNQNDDRFATTAAKKGSFLSSLTDVVRDLIAHPKKLIPTFVLTFVWILFSILSTVGVNFPFFRFLYAVTYANGGMFGGFFGMLGGIFGKAVFAAVVNVFVLSVCEKKNPFRGLKDGVSGIFKDGIKALSPLLIGGGIGVLLYFFFNVTSSVQNCAIAVACVLAGVKAVSTKSGLLYSAAFFLLGKATKGKTPSEKSVRGVLSGLTAGFAVCFPVTFLRLPILIVIFGVLLLAAGIAIPFFNKKRAVAAMLVFVTAVSFFGVSVSAASASKKNESSETESDCKPYRGRLTYSNGRKNKYGQPFPDLMDFDGDGKITWLDSDVQKELSHDPDWLDRPAHKATGIFLAILTGLFGAAGGAIGGGIGGTLGGAVAAGASEAVESVAEAVAESGSDIFSGNRYVSRDEDGDLNVTDPATGEQRLYTSNGDGTYTNPLTGATYTEAELKEYLESRAENANLIRQDEVAKDRAVSEQRTENEKRSRYGREIEEQAKKDLAEENAKIRHESYVEGLEMKYGEEGKELKKAIMQEQINAEVEGNREMAKEAYLEAGQKTAESTEKAADIAIDVLAEVTGEEGKAIKNAYTFTKSTLARGAEAYAEGRNVAQGMVHGAIEGAVSVGQNSVDGATEKLAANVSGDMFKAALESTAKGEKVDFEKVVEAGGMAAINTSVDVGLDLVGDAAKEIGDLGDDVVKTVLNTDVTSEGIADAVKAGTGDLVKEGTEKLFKTDDD